MRKLTYLLIACGAVAALAYLARPVRADEPKAPAAAAPATDTKADAKADAKAPDTIVFDKAKLGTVSFPHKAHVDKVKDCDACHGGKEPLFPQKKTELKMKDMYAGKACGSCHDGKEHFGVKAVFKAQGACAKCHKKEAPKAAP